MAERESALIRGACPEDEGALRELVPDRHRLGWRMRYAAMGQETMLVAELGGVLGGMLSIRWALGCDPPHPWLYGGAVLPSLRGRGLGTASWLRAHELCRERGAQAAALDVDVDNAAARRLYERLGYRVISAHRHSWTARDIDSGQITGTGTSDTWLMRCDLL